MNFDEFLRSEAENIQIPDELLPENIALMLKSETAKKQKAALHQSKITQRRTAVFRTVSAAAACAALAAGFLIYNDKITEPADLETEIEYKDVRTTESYEDLYDIYTRIYLNGDVSEVDELPAEDDLSPEELAWSLSDTDILRADNGTVYYINNGNICRITESGEVFSTAAGITDPLNMYIDSDRLIVVSQSAQKSFPPSDVPAEDGITAASEASDLTGSTAGSAYVTADVFDISDGVKHLETFTQSGGYVSSRVFGGNLSIVTDYYDYHTRPLSEESDLDNYVPYYELNGKRIYVAAEDIYVTSDAASTEYTVASSYNINGGAVSVKAVLGSTGRVFCPGDTLYIITPGRQSNDKPYTAISRFSLGSTIEYVSGGSVEGIILSRSLDEKDGCLRAAAQNTLDDGTVCTDIYVLDQQLSVINSAGQLLPGEKPYKVSFAGNYASIYTENDVKPSLILDISAVPPVLAQAMTDNGSPYYVSYNDKLILGAGRNEGAFELSMFDAGSGAMYDSVRFAEGVGITSPADIKKRSLLINSDLGIIGVPTSYSDEFGTHSQYFLYRYTEDNGFELAGTAEYTDSDESGIFRRSIVSGNIIYLISDARIVVADITNMRVIRTYDN